MPDITQSLHCEHEFRYQGVVYEIQDYKLPGSSAQPVFYYDLYYCRGCLKQEFKKLNLEGTTYGKLEYNARPKSVKETQ